MRKYGISRLWITAPAVLAVAAAAWAAAGSLDGTFGSGGVVETSLGDSGIAEDVAVQDDGKVLLGGWDRVGTSTYHWRIRRYGSDGSVDTGFGSGGSVSLFGSVSSDSCRDLDLDSAGRIVAVGKVAVSGKGRSWETRAALARLTASGSLDGSFGSGGTTTLSISGAAWAEGLAVAHQADGKIVVAGLAHNSVKVKGATLEDPAVFVARYSSSGTLDTSFGTNGVSVNNVGAAGIALRSPGSVALQSDGGIVVGCSQNGLGSHSWTIVRFQGDGSIDTGFGTIGSSGDDLWRLIVDGEDRILAFGMRGDGDASDAIVTRYESDGTLDSGFGSGGVVVIDLNDLDIATGGAVQSDGKIVVSAITGGSTVTQTQSATVLRLGSNGALDGTFGTGGVGTAAILTLKGEGSAPLALAPDGRAVIGGYYYSGQGSAVWYAARYDTQ